MAQFDPESGQVYKETTARAVTGFRPWQYHCRSAVSEPASARRGARSLVEHATLSFVNNYEGSQSDLLREIPHVLLGQLWRAIQHSGRDCLFIFRSFAETGFRGADFKWDKVVNDVNQPLGDYFAQATSLQCKWLVDLTIVDLEEWQTPSLADLSNLQNLANLRILRHSGAPEYMNDRILRTWSESARENGSFSKLRAIFVVHMSDVTDQAFQYLNAFPALECFSVKHCGMSLRTSTAADYGWYRTTR